MISEVVRGLNSTASWKSRKIRYIECGVTLSHYCSKSAFRSLVLHVTPSDIMMCGRVSFRVGGGTLYNRTHNNWVT